MKKLVIILGGGESPEREVSLRSAASMQQALQTAGFETILLDVPNQLHELDTIKPEDCYVFPILHGAGGEDGSIQQFLEEKHFIYLGSGPASSRIAFDKHLTRQALFEHGLPIADGELVTKENYEKSVFFQHPHVLKSCHGGSSIGTLISRKPFQNNTEEVSKVFEVSDTAVIEELVEGTEITVAIFGTKALPVIEIIPPMNGDFDYENKYNGMTKEICPPENVSSETQKQLQALAVQVHEVIGCRHLSRVDMIVRPDNTPVILEINTIPGMTDQSLYPKAARQAGYTFPALAEAFVHMLDKNL